MKLTWAPLAIQRVLEAAEFIALDKPEAARRWAESTFEAASRLRELPRSGRIVPEVNRPELREIIHGAFRIVYRIEQDEILVLTVRRSSQRFDPTEIS